MSYDRLIMCCDDSGSMSGTKITDAIQNLNNIANSLNTSTTYYKFGNSVSSVNCYTKGTLSCGQGTEIEKCLLDLFNNHLPAYAGSKTKFVFVTDAEDQIYDVNAVIAAKRRCEKAYGNRLDSYCLLTGGGGGCSSELNKIFAASFDSCSDKDFKSRMQSVSKGANTTQQANANSNAVKGNIEELTQDNNREIAAFGQTANDIMTKLNKVKEKNEAAGQKIENVKQKLVNLNTQTANLRTTVDTARTPQQFDRAEEEGIRQKREYRKQDRELSRAGKELDDSANILKTETARADALSQQLKANASKISSRAESIIASITDSIKELQTITHGWNDEVKRLKGKFRKDLDDLMAIVTENENLQDELEGLQEKINDNFNAYRDQKSTLDAFKQEIQTNMDELNDILERIDNLR